MARAYADYSREAVAIVVIRNGRVVRLNRNIRNFPFICVAPGAAVPTGSIYHALDLRPGEASSFEECDPGSWIGERDERKVSSLAEQVLAQANGFALLMLLAETVEEIEDEDAQERW